MSFINQIVSLVLAFLLRSVFVWGFGADYLGINGLFSDVMQLLTMTDLGIGTAMVYSFYKPLAEHDTDKMTALTNFYRKVYYVIATVVAVIGICLIPFLPYIVNLKREVPHLTLYYLFSLSQVVASYLCVYRTSVLTADQKDYKITRINMIMNLIKSITQILSILIFRNYIVYLAVGTITIIGQNVWASWVAGRDYPYLKKRTKVVIKKEERKSIFSNIGSAFVYKVSSVLLNATDNLAISMLISTTVVGYYSNYLTLQSKVVAMITLLFTAITASVGNLIVTETAEKRYKVFEAALSVSFIISGIVAPCFTLLVDDFIRIWLGAEYTLGWQTCLAIGLNLYMSSVSCPLWTFREATGMYRQIKWVMLICAGLNLVLDFTLGRVWGLVGIIVASALSRIVTYIWYEPKLLFEQYFDRDAKRYYLQLIFNTLLVTGVVFLFMLVWKNFYVDSIAKWILKAVVVMSGSLAIVLGVYHRTPGFRIFRRYVRKFIKVGK